MTYSVLVIEDEENIRTTRFDLEYELNCKIFTSETAEAAREALAKDRFDLLLVDVQIPESAGGKILQFGGLDVISSLHAGELGPLNIETHYLVLTAQRNSLYREKVTKDVKCLGVVGKINQTKAIDIIGGHFALKEKEVRGAEGLSSSRDKQ